MRRPQLADKPACWAWRVAIKHVAAVERCPENYGHFLLWNWQQGRCAVCAVPAGEWPVVTLLRDHDHKTGLVRGLLCERCNVGEGHTPSGSARPHSALYDRYRWNNPATMLGLQARYAITSGPTGRPLPISRYAGDLELPLRRPLRRTATTKAES